MSRDDRFVFLALLATAIASIIASCTAKASEDRADVIERLNKNIAIERQYSLDLANDNVKIGAALTRAQAEKAKLEQQAAAKEKSESAAIARAEKAEGELSLAIAKGKDDAAWRTKMHTPPGFVALWFALKLLGAWIAGSITAIVIALVIIRIWAPGVSAIINAFLTRVAHLLFPAPKTTAAAAVLLLSAIAMRSVSRESGGDSNRVCTSADSKSSGGFAANPFPSPSTAAAPFRLLRFREFTQPGDQLSFGRHWITIQNPGSQITKQTAGLYRRPIPHSAIRIPQLGVRV